VPLHGHSVAVGSHVDDRAARGVRQFAPFDYLTDIEVHHRLLLGWGMAHTHHPNAGRKRGDTGGANKCQIHLGLDTKTDKPRPGAGGARVTRRLRPASQQILRRIQLRLQLLSFWPISAMPSPRLLKNFPVSLVLTLPAFLRPSTEACVPSCNLVPDHLAAPSRLALAFLSPSVASLPDFWACSAVA